MIGSHSRRSVMDHLQIAPHLPLPRKRSPDGATADWSAWQTSNCSLLLIYLPRKDERLSWPGWLDCNGRFTHRSGHPSAGRAQDRESSPSKYDSRRRLRSATTQRLLVRRTRLRTIGNRAFAVAPRVWNDLPADIVSAPSLAIFKRRLKTHLFGQSFGWQLTLLPVLEALLTAG